MIVQGILLHQDGNKSANILWAPPLHNDVLELIPNSLDELRKFGYFASAFPEGDGITLSSYAYDPAQALNHIAFALPWISFDRDDAKATLSERLNRLNKNRTISVRYFVPANTLRIDSTIALGPYTIHRPIIPYENTIDDNPWAMDLCDIPGIDVDPSWNPANADQTTLASTLQWPMIEARTEINASLLYPYGDGRPQLEPLALYVTEHADRVLDVLRFEYCSQDMLEQVPQHAGIDMRYGCRTAYIMPEVDDIKHDLVLARPQVFEAISMQVGLAIHDDLSKRAVRLATIASGQCDNEVEQLIRSVLRSRGQSFFLVNPEMRFLSLIFATDVIAGVTSQKGVLHRTHIANLAANGDQERFDLTLREITELYGLRNQIVHKGRSFLELARDPLNCIQAIDEIFMLCLNVVISSDWVTVDEISRSSEKGQSSYGT